MEGFLQGFLAGREGFLAIYDLIGRRTRPPLFAADRPTSAGRTVRRALAYVGILSPRFARRALPPRAC